MLFLEKPEVLNFPDVAEPYSIRELKQNSGQVGIELD